MDYKNYVEIVKIEDIIDEPSFEPSESYNNSTIIYITSQNNDYYTEPIIIVIFSSIASFLFILFLLWYKYIRKKSNIKKNQMQGIYIENNYRKEPKEDLYNEQGLDYEFGTRFILDDN